jgi:hypothetical protein
VERQSCRSTAKLEVASLLRIDPDGLSLVADLLDLIDTVSSSNGFASGIVSNEGDVHTIEISNTDVPDTSGG